MPVGVGLAEYEIKKSRFHARAALAGSRDQALEVLQAARQAWPDARHHCWAYVIGNPRSPSAVASSDDGEPGGTAGRPILNVLQHKQVGDIMLVVSRYFGGVKLGAGGLVRAYSQAAQAAMEQLLLAQNQPQARCQLQGSYALEQPLRHWLQQHDGEVLEVDYSDVILCRVLLPDQYLGELQQFARLHGALLQISA
ncbi:YigZ family protein [Pseudomaricurvus alcaniphilus]|nr:YigZ family protein [Pseudomaricurvus alcaniphilus]